MTDLHDHPTMSVSRPPRVWQDGFRPLLQRLHFFAGVLVGPFLLVAAVTGLLYTVAPQAEHLVHHRALHASGEGAGVSLAQQVATAQARVPEGTLSRVRPADEDANTRVVFSVPSVADDEKLTVFVDPGTGEIRDVLPTYGEWLPARTLLDKLHRHLLLGEVGRVYAELAASWLWVMALGGLALWLGRHRRRLSRALVPGRGGSARARVLSWHGVVGVWALVGLLFLSATGITWSLYGGENVGQLRHQLQWRTPTPQGAVPESSLNRGDLGVAVEGAVSAARQAGLDGRIVVSVAGPGLPWKVAQAKRSWPVKQDAIAVDPGSGRVLDRVDFDDWPLAAKLTRWGIDAHMGLLFGIANQIVLAAVVVAAIALVILGYRQWWLRRSSGAGLASRGAVTHRAAPITLGLLAIAVGLFLPVLGASLLLFVVADAAWAVFRRA